MIFGAGLLPCAVKELPTIEGHGQAEQFGGLLGTFHPIASALSIAFNVRQVNAYMGMLRQNVISSAANEDKDNHSERDERVFNSF